MKSLSVVQKIHRLIIAAIVLPIYAIPVSELHYQKHISSAVNSATSILPSSHSFPQATIFTFKDEHSEIDKWISYYRSDSNRRWVQTMLNNAGRYTGYIREEVISRGLPPELIFLPAVESGFNPYAVSKSGAVGLWQFMTNSIGPFSISVNEWVDERRDLKKSTVGALDKLEYNYSMLGDWLLAIAAYNCGLGGLQRAMKASNTHTYWEVRNYLPKETQQYIPKFLSLARIFMYPEHYGFISPDSPQVKWNFLPYNGVINMQLLSVKTGVPINTLKYWHPELKTLTTPPDESVFILKIPSDYSDIISRTVRDEKFSGINYITKTIQRGDTLFSIAQSIGTNVDTLLFHNPMLKPHALMVGDILLIPDTGSINLPERSLDISKLTEYSEYTVKKGDTLWSISRTYGIYPEHLAYWNRIDVNEPIQPGQKLRVPVSGGNL